MFSALGKDVLVLLPKGSGKSVLIVVTVYLRRVVPHPRSVYSYSNLDIRSPDPRLEYSFSVDGQVVFAQLSLHYQTVPCRQMVMMGVAVEDVPT